MDYKKKYNEAMLRADEAVQKGCLDKDMFNIIFPPDESEDERIRKFLLEYAIEMIAGLESDISLSIYDGIKGHDPDAEAELAQWQKARAYLEKQKEQKPIQTDAEKEYVRTLKSLVADFVRANNYIERGYYQQIYDWLDGRHVEQKEQKPCGCVNVESEYDKGWRDGHKAGLKDAEMQKPAWSDEDDQLIGFIFDLLNDLTWRKDWAMSKEECLERLKSLRPSWKPSEEQMAWLKLAIDEAKEPLKSQLEELYKNIRENLIWK